MDDPDRPLAAQQDDEPQFAADSGASLCPRSTRQRWLAAAGPDIGQGPTQEREAELTIAAAPMHQHRCGRNWIWQSASLINHWPDGQPPLNDLIRGPSMLPENTTPLVPSVICTALRPAPAKLFPRMFTL